jgi:hypothetical protein
MALVLAAERAVNEECPVVADDVCKRIGYGFFLAIKERREEASPFPWRSAVCAQQGPNRTLPQCSGGPAPWLLPNPSPTAING